MTVNAAGDTIIQAVRELLGTFQTNSTGIQSPVEMPTVTQLTQAPTAMAQYQSLALLAATIRWAAHETGRGEEELLDELAKNYASPG